MISQADPNRKTVWTPVLRDSDGLFVAPPDTRWHSDAWFRAATWDPARGQAYTMLYTLPSKMTPKGRVYEWTVPEPAEFDVLVRAAITHEPLAQAAVELLWSGQGIENARGAKAIPDYDPIQHMPLFSHVAQDLGHGVTGADGTVRVRGMQMDPVFVRCSLAGYRTEIAEAGKDRRVVVDLTCCGYAEGILVGATGEVFVSSAPMDPAAEQRLVPGQSVEMTGGGHFILRGYGVGRYRLFVYDRERRGRFLGEIDVVPGSATPIRFQVPDLQPIRFGIRSTDLRVGDTVQVVNAVGSQVLARVEEPERAWLDLCAGEYRAFRIRGEGPHGELAFGATGFEVSSTGPKEVVVGFPRSRGQVRLLENGRPAARQWVRLAGQHGVAAAPSMWVTDADGWLRLPGVPDGEFTLREQRKVLTRFDDGPRRWRVRPSDLGASVDVAR